MKNRKMLLPALLTIILSFGLIFPALVARASAMALNTYSAMGAGLRLPWSPQATITRWVKSSLANSDGLNGGPCRIRTHDTLIKVMLTFFRMPAFFKGWNRPENYSIFKQSG